jgi:hypothetical protein
VEQVEREREKKKKKKSGMTEWIEQWTTSRGNNRRGNKGVIPSAQRVNTV